MENSLIDPLLHTIESIEVPETAEPESTEREIADRETADRETTEPESLKRKPYGRRLSEEDDILLFQLCIQHSLSFRAIKNQKQFWIKISALFEQSAKHLYS
jgi:hypothetical protein